MDSRRLVRNFIIAFIVFITLVFFAIRIFGGGNEPKTTPRPPGPVVKPLPEYADTLAEVSMTVDGRINGDDAHRQIRITVDRFQRRLEIIAGYQGNVIQKNEFQNSQKAYETFLRSLNNSGFLAKRNNGTNTNPDGQCPLGRRFIYELNDSGDVLSRLWTTTCGSRTGTLAGNSATLQSIFQAQITDYNKLISTSKVSSNL